MALSANQIRKLWIRQGGAPKYANVMSRIALRESGGRPKINNRGTNRNGTVDWGLFQINDIWRKDPVVGPLFRSGAILTPQGNAQAAVHILKVQGPKAWATYNPAVDAKYIGQMGSGGGGSQSAAAASPARAPLMDLAIGHKQTFDQAGFEKAKRAALVGGLIARRRGTNNILFRSGLLTTTAPDPSQFIKTSLVTQARAAATPATGSLGDSPLTNAGSASDKVRAMIERANAIDAKHYNYEWGGGHNPGVAPTHGSGHGSGPGIGFDCSGAVSKVLGVDARVSGEFARWGKPGRAPGGKGVTVYANSTHVFLEINGHYFGTSGANPGGGAGWIPRSAINAAYLRNFTARHL